MSRQRLGLGAPPDLEPARQGVAMVRREVRCAAWFGAMLLEQLNDGRVTMP